MSHQYRSQQTAIGLCLLVLSAAGGAAWAGTITGVAASPNPATRPQAGSTNVIINIVGTGSCRSVKLRYGDGARETVPNIDFSQPPRALLRQHPYAMDGTFRIQVLGSGDCPLQRETRLMVRPSVARTLRDGGLSTLLRGFCRLVSCECQVRTIKQLPPLTSSLTAEPFSTIILRGCGFTGDPNDRTPLELTLYLIDYTGQLFSRDLEVLPGARDDLVLALIPGDITEVMDQTVEIQARRGRLIGPVFKPGFRATREIVRLGERPGHRSLVVQLPSPTNADDDHCVVMGWITIGFAIYRGTIICTHSNYFYDVSDDSGTDVFQVGPAARKLR
jgi:hypothetical protein